MSEKQNFSDAVGSYRYITRRPGSRAGRAYVAGSRLGVHDVVAIFLNGSPTIEEVCREFPTVTWAQFYECLAYYEDHRAEIDDLVAEQKTDSREPPAPEKFYRHLTRIPGVRSGRPIIAGTRLGVHDVVCMFILGSTVDEICRSYPFVTRAQVYACLAYYEDHRAEIDESVAGVLPEPDR